MLYAFPSAFGAGAFTIGGRGGIVVHVTNLNDSGTGSLRSALVDYQDQDRTIVFDVSGVIKLNSDIVFSGPRAGGNASGQFTVAGQSAPKGGITVTGGKIRMFSVDECIWRYTKFRETTPTDGCLSSTDGNNVIFDHLTGSHTPDIAFALVSNAEITTGKTFQNCLVGQALNGLIVGDTTPQGDVDYGEISVLRNGYYNVSHRVPMKTGGGVKVDAINNMGHNWAARLIRCDDWDFTLNHIGNYYQSGINSTNRLLHCAWDNNPNGNYLIHTVDNYMSPNKQPVGYESDERVAWTEFQNNFVSLPLNYFTDVQFPIKGREIEILPSSQVKGAILPEIGACRYIDDNGQVQYERDSYDTSFIAGMYEDDGVTRSTVLNSITSESNTRPVDFYQSNPHIPEAYLNSRGIVGNANIHNQVQPSGYTLLEEYLNQVDVSFVSQVPVITLNGDSIIDLELGESYVELGATAFDTEEGDLTSNIVITGSVDVNTEGTYYRYYNVQDSNLNNAVQVIRTINVTEVLENIVYPLTNSQKIVDKNSIIKLKKINV